LCFACLGCSSACCASGSGTWRSYATRPDTPGTIAGPTRRSSTTRSHARRTHGSRLSRGVQTSQSLNSTSASAVAASRVRELVIFDCDGVLVDSEPIAVGIDQRVLRGFGIVLTEAEVMERFLGRSPSVMVAALEAHIGRPLERERRDQYERLYAEAYERELVAVEGVQDALDRIPYPACVASSSEPASLRRKLELTGLDERFAGRM